MADGTLAAFARFELESRQRNYPRSVANGKLPADQATIDFQAWHVITVWLETGRFVSIDAGGVDHRTIIGWAACERAANQALKTTGEAQASALEAGDKAKADRLEARLGGLRLIAAAVAAGRRQIDLLNQALRARRDQPKEIAA